MVAARRIGARRRGVRVRPPARAVRVRVRARHHARAARRRRQRRAGRGCLAVPRGRHDAARDSALAAARGRVDARELLRPRRRARAMAGASGVGRSAALSRLGVRVGGARPRAAPGRALTARCARAEPQPVRFVNSLGLGKQPSIEPVRRRLARSPGVRFKLDAEATWARRSSRRSRPRERSTRSTSRASTASRSMTPRRWPRSTTTCSRRSRTPTSRTRTTCQRSHSGSANTSRACRTTRRSATPRTSARRRWRRAS